MELQFEKASRKKLRFETSKGNLTVEDLWDVPLISTKGGISLDDIAKDLNKKLKESDTESFVVKDKKDDSCIRLKFDIVIHIINVKLEERDKAEKLKINKEKRDKLLSLIARKEDDMYGQKSIEELKAELQSIADTM